MELKRILVPIDFSEISLAALDSAAFFAHKLNSEIVLLHVFEEPEFYASANELKEALNKVVKEEVANKMSEIISSRKDLQGLTIYPLIEAGRTHQVINAVAEGENCDLIIMGTHGASGISDPEKYILGSNAHRVVNSSKVPVLTIRGNKVIRKIENIVLPIDLTKETLQKEKAAVALAKLFNATIHVVTVIGFFSEYNPKVDDLIIEQEKFTERLEQQDISYVEARIEYRDIADSIIDYAVENEADLILIMTRQENIVEELFLGSTARKIVSRSPVPVLSIHPKKD